MFPVDIDALLLLFEEGAVTPLESLICAQVRIMSNELMKKAGGEIEDYYEVALESLKASYQRAEEEKAVEEGNGFKWHPIALLYTRNKWGAELFHHLPISEIKRLLEYELTRPYKPQSTN